MRGLLGRMLGRGAGGLSEEAMSNDVTMQMRALLKQQMPQASAQIDAASDDQIMMMVQQLKAQMAPGPAAPIEGSVTSSPYAPRGMGYNR